MTENNLSVHQRDAAQEVAFALDRLRSCADLIIAVSDVGGPLQERNLDAIAEAIRLLTIEGRKFLRVVVDE